MTTEIAWVLSLLWLSFFCNLSYQLITKKQLQLFGAFLLTTILGGTLTRYNVEVRVNKHYAKTQLQNDSLTRALDSLRTQKTPCPDTLFIFLPPMR